MALYEYACPDCGNVFEKRMPMTEVVQLVPCPNCGKSARKVLGSFAVAGLSKSGLGDGPAPWDADGDEFGGGAQSFDDYGEGGWGQGDDHGHSHGPGTHTH